MISRAASTSEAVAPRTPRGRSRLPDVDLLFVEDVAMFCGVTPAAIRKRIRLGQLGAWMKSGNRHAIRKTTFERFLDEQEQAGI